MICNYTKTWCIFKTQGGKLNTVHIYVLIINYLYLSIYQHAFDWELKPELPYTNNRHHLDNIKIRKYYLSCKIMMDHQIIMKYIDYEIP